MQRILVIGGPGAGKSTLSIELGDILNLPVYHLDKNFWQPGWHKSEHERWLENVRRLASGDKWIIDGNYSHTFNIRFPEADTVIFLDFKTSLCLRRIFKRLILGYHKVRADMAEGCPERWDWQFILYVLNFRRNERNVILEYIERYSDGRQIITLTRPRQVGKLVSELRSCQTVW
jgi:adenylate kinase family enzyme